MAPVRFEEYIEPLKVYLQKYREVHAYLVMWQFFSELIRYVVDVA